MGELTFIFAQATAMPPQTMALSILLLFVSPVFFFFASYFYLRIKLIRSRCASEISDCERNIANNKAEVILIESQEFNNRIVRMKSNAKLTAFSKKVEEYPDKYEYTVNEDLDNIINETNREKELYNQQLIANVEEVRTKITTDRNAAIATEVNTSFLRPKSNMELQDEQANVRYKNNLNNINVLRIEIINNYLRTKDFESLSDWEKNLVLQILNFQFEPNNVPAWENKIKRRNARAQASKNEAEAESAQEEARFQRAKREAHAGGNHV